jgi:transcriptional regulator with XRE-family HTH domain
VPLPPSLYAELYDALQRALRHARKARGMTQSMVAARLHKPQSFVAKYERGDRRLDVVEFLLVCAALDINAIDVIERLCQPTVLSVKLGQPKESGEP